MGTQAGELVGGRYHLEQRIGSGGMSLLWSAHDTQLDVRVAVKLLSLALLESPEMRARFEQEAKAGARLQSPHIVSVRDYGVDGGQPFIVMELLVGQDLAQRIKGNQRLRLAEAADIIRQVSEALTCAADAGIIHRDLKPANVFLCRSNPGPSSHGTQQLCKVLDFGVAKIGRDPAHDDGPLTQTGELLGTPHYMSPEQALGAPLDPRCDVWALGMLAFRMLAGHMAVQASTAGAAIVQIANGQFLTLSQVAPELTRTMGPFFERAFASSIHQRFQSARELSVAFSAAVQAANLSTSGASWPSEPRPPYVPENVVSGASIAAISAEAHRPPSHRRALVAVLSAVSVVAAGTIIAMVATRDRAPAASAPTPALEPLVAPSETLAETPTTAAPSSSLPVVDPGPPASATTAPSASASTERARSPRQAPKGDPDGVPDFGY